MHVSYSPKGVCAMKIDFELNDGIVSGVEFMGGCNGNLKAISKLVEGMKGEDVVRILEGNECGFKGTSCADQLAIAIKNNL